MSAHWRRQSGEKKYKFLENRLKQELAAKVASWKREQGELQQENKPGKEECCRKERELEEEMELLILRNIKIQVGNIRFMLMN